MIKAEHFEWDPVKDAINQIKHGVSFLEAQHAFADPECIIAHDDTHSLCEDRYFCFGKLDHDVITVRFTIRNNRIRIFGAGYWRKGKLAYEEKNKIYRR